MKKSLKLRAVVSPTPAIIAAAYDENGKADACTLAFYTPTSHKPPTLSNAGSYSKRRNGMQSQMTISFLGLWEKLHNPDFKGVDFVPLLSMAEQSQRLKKLNEIAIQQMRILSEVEGRKFLK